MSTTLRAGWAEYREAVYPRGIPPMQDAECGRAFMAGAMNALHEVQKLAGLPEAMAVLQLEELIREGRDYAKEAAAQMLAARRCQCKDCAGEGHWMPVLELRCYANQAKPAEARLGIRAGDACKESKGPEDFTTDEGWGQICSAMELAKKMVPERGFTTVRWMRIG